jgi:hypothetical protein
MVDVGLASPELLAAAGREADLLEHPYVGREHIELATFRANGQMDEYNALRSTLSVGI